MIKSPTKTSVKPPRQPSAPSPTESPGKAEHGDAPPAAPIADGGPRPRSTKTDAVIAMLRQPTGASLDEIVAATGWQRHSARGALAGAVRKKLGAGVISEMIEGERRYRAPEVTL